VALTKTNSVQRKPCVLNSLFRHSVFLCRHFLEIVSCRPSMDDRTVHFHFAIAQPHHGVVWIWIEAILHRCWYQISQQFFDEIWLRGEKPSLLTCTYYVTQRRHCCTVVHLVVVPAACSSSAAPATSSSSTAATRRNINRKDFMRACAFP
jgi:hypothetical protein